MTYVVTEACIKCKYMDCVVKFCPVDCFYEGDNMLVINPDECIDCGRVRTRVPAPNAILPDTEKGSGAVAGTQPQPGERIGRTSTRKGEAPADADAFKDEKDKFKKYFSNKARRTNDAAGVGRPPCRPVDAPGHGPPWQHS